MEQNKFNSWVEKNKTLLTYIIMGTVVAIVLVGGTLSRYSEETPNEMEKVVTDTAQVANTAAIITPIVAEAGRGEVVFMLSSKSGGAVVREIHLHNPYKDSWVLAYDGYKTVSTELTEVYRTNLAAITYDKAQVRTLDNFFVIENPVKIMSEESTIVNLEI
ncbi:MAG: hypothetical protein AAB847_01020 [Patescibacteria group bacterium]